MQAGAPVVSAPGTVPASFLPEPDDVKIDEGTKSLESVPCALSADGGGELPLVQSRVSGFPGVLRCVRGRGQPSLRCWPENDLQFHGSESKGELKRSGKRRQPSLRCWPETDEQFRGSESQGQLHGRRGPGARTLSSSRCSSSAQGGLLRVLHALRRVQVLILRSRTVLSRVTLPSCYVWSLHRHVSGASVLLCMVMTVHATHLIH